MSKKPDASDLPAPLNVLIVDDEAPHAESIAEGLTRHGYICRTANSPAQARGRLQGDTPPDILITDLRLETGAEGLELLALAKQIDPKIEVILVTAHGTIDTCRAALQQGAFDYITKPLDWGELRAVVRRAGEKVLMGRQIVELRQRLDEKFGVEGIIGQSPAMTRIIRTVRQIAASNIPVLLQGESGTGKELLANAIHVNSERRNRPFVALNCAGLSESILEDELFGHVRGAFTGAAGERKGRFEHANGGTLFLDEIGDMPGNFQAKLLRVLENGEMVRLGSNEPIRVDVRLISATNRDLGELVDRKQFRQDLYFRVKGVTVTIPPLRQRREDIPLLVEHFLRLAAEARARPGGQGAPIAADRERGPRPPAISPAAMRLLAGADWPGNVRQLKTAIDTMLVLADPDQATLDVADVPDDIRAKGGTGGLSASISPGPGTARLAEADTGPGVEQPARTGGPGLVGMSIEQAERILIENTLALVGGNREQAAKMLGIGERTLYRKIKEYGLADEGEGQPGE